MIKKLYENSIVRYFIFGVCTTLVNLVTFYGLRKTGMALQLANVISILIAILFAYVVNSRFVFRNRCRSMKEFVCVFSKFVSARLITMVVEVGGVWLFVSVLGLYDMVGKFFTQFLVFVLNYVFSKFLVFTSNRKEKR